jgi:YggT family protein
MIRYIVHLLFATYTFMLLARVMLSWFPDFQRYRLTRFLIFYTEPYLALFRRVIPPIGGMMDLSPLIAFFALRFLEQMLMVVL